MLPSDKTLTTRRSTVNLTRAQPRSRSVSVPNPRSSTGPSTQSVRRRSGAPRQRNDPIDAKHVKRRRRLSSRHVEVGPACRDAGKCGATAGFATKGAAARRNPLGRVTRSRRWGAWVGIGS